MTRLALVSDKVFLGTSGWSYKEWVGPFYSREDKSLLKAYTRVFKTVEIDSTFYRYPAKGVVMGWARYSPEGFVYTAKLPKLITHEKELDLSRGAEEDLRKFLDLMEPLSLSGKLGCLLIQLPPRYDYRPNELEDFFDILPTHVRFAIEFRNRSWMRPETWPLLENHKVAYAIVDEPLLPPETHLTASFAYFRWHGKGARPWFDYRYERKELEPWIPKIKEASERVKRVYGYFNNHFHGYAVENCLQVVQMLGNLTPEQTQAQQKVENHFKTAAKLKDSKLESFFKQPDPNIENLLTAFTDEGRLKRAREIADSELKLETATSQRIEAAIRNYHITIDANTKTIEHDCEDWTKGLVARRFCKHVAKLFLSIEGTQAMSMLKNIHTHRNEWQFKTYI